MSRFDGAAQLLATAWQFGEPRADIRDTVWAGGAQGEELRTSVDQERQHLRIEHNGFRLALTVPSRSTAAEIIAFLDELASAIGEAGQQHDAASDEATQRPRA